MNSILWLIRTVIFWRVLLFVPLAFCYFLIPYRTGFEFTNILNKIPKDSFINSPLLYSWVNFDGVHYLAIAGNGYTSDGRFFPLFPLVIHYLSSIFGDSRAFSTTQIMVAIIFSSLVFLLSLIFLSKLIRLDYQEKIAKWSIIFLLVFPTSFFFVSIYAEGLFLLLLILSFYFARKGQWLLASIFGLLLSVTRPVGILIFPVLVYEFYLQQDVSLRDIFKTPWQYFKKMLPLIIIPFGLIFYGFYCWTKWNNPFFFITAQGLVENGRSVSSIVTPPQLIFRYLKIFTTVSTSQYEWWIALLEFSAFFLVLTLLIFAWKKKIRKSYLLFSVLALLVPVLSGTLSGLPRYIIILFPIYIALALIKSNIFKYVFLFFSAFLLIILLMLFSRGYFIA